MTFTRKWRNRIPNICILTFFKKMSHLGGNKWIFIDIKTGTLGCLSVNDGSNYSPEGGEL